jgi:hypothetical protein
MAGAWARDVARCNLADLGLITEMVKSLAHRLVEDENKPNPSPALVRALANATERYVDALDRVTGGSRGLDESVADLLKPQGAPGDRPAPFEHHDTKTGLRILRSTPGLPGEARPVGSSEQEAKAYPSAG